MASRTTGEGFKLAADGRFFSRRAKGWLLVAAIAGATTAAFASQPPADGGAKPQQTEEQRRQYDALLRRLGNMPPAPGPNFEIGATIRYSDGRLIGVSKDGQHLCLLCTAGAKRGCAWRMIAYAPLAQEGFSQPLVEVVEVVNRSSSWIIVTNDQLVSIGEEMTQMITVAMPKDGDPVCDSADTQIDEKPAVRTSKVFAPRSSTKEQQ
jgi:hypothetical protein